MTVHSLLSPRQARGCKKADHINQMYMAGFNAIPRKRGSYMVFDLFYRDITDLFNRCLSFSR